jgi:hypothetical protein
MQRTKRYRLMASNDHAGGLRTLSVLPQTKDAAPTSASSRHWYNLDDHAAAGM